VYDLLSVVQIFKLPSIVHCADLLFAFSYLEATRVPLLLEKENHDHEKFFRLYDQFALCLNLFLHEGHVNLLLLSFEFFNLYLIFILKFSNSIINFLSKFKFILQDFLSHSSTERQEIE